MSYDDLKKHFGEVYSGMSVGGVHNWNYNNAVCNEQKVHPHIWLTRLQSVKKRKRDAPVGSGVDVGTKFHWVWVGDQIAEKINENEYMTDLQVLKFKMGHKRKHWKSFSYHYPEQKSYLDALEMHFLNLLNIVKRAKVYSEIRELPVPFLVNLVNGSGNIITGGERLDYQQKKLVDLNLYKVKTEVK